MVAPKPDLTALTGGYRKTPVLQVGADTYCDTDCIVRVLDRLEPEPSLFWPATEALSLMIGPWQGELFWNAVQLAGATGDVFPEGFVEDRDKMIPGGLDVEKMLVEIPATRDRLRAKLGMLEGLLAEGRPDVLGEHASLADFSVFHPLFALKTLGPTAEVLEPYTAVRAWLERVDAFGHGSFTQLESADAVAIARRSTPATAAGADAADPNGRKPGDRVRIVHESFGNDPVSGELVSSSAQQIAIRREDERAGEVVVHFPHEHYVVLAAS